jgi:[ribosomal protein S18]-alanine N-acetyltransferase
MAATMPQETNPTASTERKPRTLGVRIVVRPMVLEDLDQVVAIDQSSFSLPWPARSFRYELLENDVARLWVAAAETAAAGTDANAAGNHPILVGMIVVWLILDEAHIATIAVHPGFRRLGIGWEIMRTALRGCAAQGAKSATLEVRENNVNAIEMYRKLGFKVVGRRKHYYMDTNEDAILMTLIMSDSNEPETPAGSNGGERES